MLRVNLRYNRRNRLKADGTAAIEIELYLDGKQKYLTTGISVIPEFWNEKKQEVKKHKDAIVFNSQISKRIEEIRSFEYRLDAFGEELTWAKLENFLDSGGKLRVSFIEFYEEQVHKQGLAKGSVKSHRSTIMHLKKFRKSISFNDLNYKLITDFDQYLRMQGLHTNTIWNQHKNVKAFINIALKSDMITENPYKKFKMLKADSTRQSLTDEQLQKLESIVLDDDSGLEHVRNMFLFACYTGIRFSDLMDLTKDSFYKEGDELMLKFAQNKSVGKLDDKFVVIPLGKVFGGKALRIVERYMQMPGERFFPKYENQSVNRPLKIIAGILGIKFNLTFHVSRHTFCTRLASLSSDPYLIMKLAGHSDIRIALKYIHTSGADVNRKLDSINW